MLSFRLLKKLFPMARGGAPKRASSAGTKRLVWRISEANPRGAWVDPDSIDSAPAAPPPPNTEPTSSGWLTSSMDLLGGAEVHEHPHPDDAAHEDTHASVFIDAPQPSVPPKRK